MSVKAGQAILEFDDTGLTQQFRSYYDKLGMMNQPRWRNQHPYHFLMEILVEKYAQFLERQNDTGDIMPEGRKGKKDTALQKSFENVLKKGTYYVPAARIKRAS